MIFSSQNKIWKSYLDHLKQGKILLYPTETVWGLGVDVMNQKAVQLLYRFKKRDSKKPVSLLVRNIKEAKKIAVISSSVEKLIQIFCPGPVTFVLPLRNQFLRSIGLGNDFVGLRFSSHPLAALLAWSYKNPITSTSANLSGKKSFSIHALKKLAQSSRKVKMVSMQDLGFIEKDKDSEKNLSPYQEKDFLNSESLKKNFEKRKKSNSKKSQRIEGSTVLKIEDQKITLLRKGPLFLEDLVSISSNLGLRI